MNTISLLKMLIKEIVHDDSIVNVAGGRGFSAGKVMSGGKPLMGFGKSELSYEYPDEDEEEDKNDTSDNDVKVSRVFKKDEFEDHYEYVLERLLNEK